MLRARGYSNQEEKRGSTPAVNILEKLSKIVYCFDNVSHSLAKLIAPRIVIVCNQLVANFVHHGKDDAACNFAVLSLHCVRLSKCYV